MDAFSRCACCKRPLDEEDLLSNRRRRYCSEICARAMINRFEEEDRSRSTILYMEALRLLRIVKTEPKRCAECGKEFQTDAHDQKFCGHSCAANRRVRELNEQGFRRDCEWCGTPFIAHGFRAKFCSGACNQAYQAARQGKLPARLKPHVFDHFFTVPINAAPRRLTAAGIDWFFLDQGLRITVEPRAGV